MNDISYIERELQADPSLLRENIVRDIGNFTVALFAIAYPKDTDLLELTAKLNPKRNATAFHALSRDLREPDGPSRATYCEQVAQNRSFWRSNAKERSARLLGGV